MSVKVAVPSSPTPSLIEVKAETLLVLKSFLGKTLSIPNADRPGRIGGEYHDPNKYSASLKEKQRKEESGWDSLDEQISAAEEKKHGIKNLIKRRLKPRPFTTRSWKKDGSTEPLQTGHSKNDTLEKQSGLEKRQRNGSAANRSEQEDGSSASEAEGERKLAEKKKKKNKLKDLFRIRAPKDTRVKESKEGTHPPRPSSLFIEKNSDPAQPMLSPSHPPEFYEDVAHRLDRIAQSSVKAKSPVRPEPIKPAEHDKRAVVQALVQVLTTEADVINEKINANPLLLSSLNRLSYPSFANLLDKCTSFALDPPVPAPGSPTLRRLAITMEMTRRVVTASGVPQRMEGFAERYMENFTPWVKSHGGWESIVQMEAQEYD